MLHYLCYRPIIGKSTISFKLEREGNPAVNVKEILQSCVTGKQWCARPLKAVTNTTNPHDESITYNQKCALFSNKKWHGQTGLKKMIILNKIMTQLREEYYLNRHPDWFSWPILAFGNIWVQIQESNSNLEKKTWRDLSSLQAHLKSGKELKEMVNLRN